MPIRDDECRITVTLPVKLVRDIDLYCAASGLSRSSVINKAASCFLILPTALCLSLQRVYAEGVIHE